MAAENDRDEEDGQHRQHARRGADQTPRHDAPRAAGQLVNHAERQAAERRAEHEHVGRQVRLKKLRRVREQPDDRHDGTDAAGHQQFLLEGRQLGNQLVGRLPQCHFYSVAITREAGPLAWRRVAAAWPRALCNRHVRGGTSSSVAEPASWSARMYAAIAHRSAGLICAA